MAKRDILQYPDPRLRTPARAVEVIDARIHTLIEDMFETMYDAPGIGLAATQIDVHEQVVVMDLSESGDEPLVLINPEVVERDTQCDIAEEGCLSIAGYLDNVERPERVTVRALNRDGEAFELEAEGLLARCIQHELDHLEGRLFIDHLSDLKRKRLRRRFEKAARQRGDGSLKTGAV
ncbi:peptide deformylase [Spiribacter salinus M19-40]|jgi:peptide deformylase|uniref:Peptide deformylase n=1 Tax=Spiribacter salinus M19-40 TaxID=1260251 RepID=R4VHQ7_9GAMM|nr:peptide deformylase [Spiribacter salinus]AGM40157.1 peptide deformylase [Spiribacter salinus M19-40]MBY5268612.1 peptide deformylase [Spiribacter salinus]